MQLLFPLLSHMPFPFAAWLTFFLCRIELPALKDVGGKFNIQSSGDLDCEESGLDKLSGSTQGKATCEGGVDDPQSVNPSGTSDGSDPKSTDAAGLIQPPLMMAMLSVLGGAIQFAL